ncbi:transcriptional regulator [bacterium]|nr:transcriptional regulator [bacterium]
MEKTSCAGPCPTRDLLARLGDKWSILVILSLAKSNQKTMRFSALQKQVAGISQRMLTATLRYLERDGIVCRTVYPEIPPRVEYNLTERGQNLMIPLRSLFEWVEVHWPDIELSRKEYDLK